jgi:hypothetical protein
MHAELRGPPPVKPRPSLSTSGADETCLLLGTSTPTRPTKDLQCADRAPQRPPGARSAQRRRRRSRLPREGGECPALVDIAVAVAERVSAKAQRRRRFTPRGDGAQPALSHENDSAGFRAHAAPGRIRLAAGGCWSGCSEPLVDQPRGRLRGLERNPMADAVETFVAPVTGDIPSRVDHLVFGEVRVLAAPHAERRRGAFRPAGEDVLQIVGPVPVQPGREAAGPA